MRNRFRWLSILLIVLLCLQATCVFAEPSDYDKKKPEQLQPDHLYGKASILIDMDSGEVLFEKNPNEKMYPASTTKVLTLMLALESGIPLDTEIVVPQQAAQVPADSSLVPVMPGDRLSFRDLLYGFMINSGNDGANAVAVIVGGSIDDFVMKMNKRAASLGCTGTHFVNAHGYHDPDHYTTVRDMSLIARQAMNYPEFRKIVSSVEYTMHVLRNGEEIEIELITRNAMMRDTMSFFYGPCIGIKTGFHSAAGYCYVSAAERDGVRLLSVDFDAGTSANDKWTDAIRMFNYGFTHYIEYTLEEMYRYAGDRIATVKISNAIKSDEKNGLLSLDLAQISNMDYVRMVEMGNQEALAAAVEDFISRSELQIEDDLLAPITRGEIVGKFRYQALNGDIITAKLIAGRDIAEQPSTLSIIDFFPVLNNLKNPLVVVLLLVIAAIIILLIIYSIDKRIQREKKRSKMFEERNREWIRKERKRRAEAASKRMKRTKAGALERELFGDFDKDERM